MAILELDNVSKSFGSGTHRADVLKNINLSVAEGEAAAIRSVYQAIHDGNPSNDLLAIKYLETLQKLGDGQATKIIVPTELGGLAGALIGYSLVELQCSGDCALPLGLGIFLGAVAAAGGMSIVAVLVMRALGEWRELHDQ